MMSKCYEWRRYRINRGSFCYVQEHYIFHNSCQILTILLCNFTCSGLCPLLPVLRRAFRRVAGRYHGKYTNVGITFLNPSYVSIERDEVVLTKDCGHDLSQWIVLQMRASFWVQWTLVPVGEDVRTVHHDGVEVKARGVIDEVLALGKLIPIEAGYLREFIIFTEMAVDLVILRCGVLETHSLHRFLVAYDILALIKHMFVAWKILAFVEGLS